MTSLAIVLMEEAMRMAPARARKSRSLRRPNTIRSRPPNPTVRTSLKTGSVALCISLVKVIGGAGVLVRLILISRSLVMTRICQIQL